MVAVLIIKYYFALGELIVLVVAQSSYFLFLLAKNCSCLFCCLWTFGEAEASRHTVHGGLGSGCCTLQKHLALVSLDQAPAVQDTESLC